MKDFWIFAVGGLAQILFSARTLIQWLRSERARKVLSPVIFWQFSLFASLLMLIYGILRDDLVIILGQLLAYFVYIRNLHLHEKWTSFPVILRLGFLIFPLFALSWIVFGSAHNWYSIIYNHEVTLSMLTLGTVGQVIFSLRFLFQWLHSEKHKESAFPPAFWIISISGSMMILLYGFLRKDPVLILGQSFGLLVYSRNLFLHYHHLGLKASGNDV